MILEQIKRKVFDMGVEGYSNRQVRLLDAMTLYCGKLRTVEELMDITGLTNKEKTLMHLLDLYKQGLITKYTAEVYNSDEIETYYLINDMGKVTFSELLDKYGEELLDECMTQVEVEDSALAKSQ